MTVRPAIPDASIQRTGKDLPPQERTPWLLGLLCLLIPIIPTYVVLSGPLKSNGAPARVIAILMFGLLALGFAVTRRTSPGRRIKPGVVILLLYYLLWLLVYGVGLLTIDDAGIAANKTRAVIVLTAHVGVGLFALNMVKTPRQRKIVLGCLLVGLAFDCLTGFLQSVSSIDLKLLFQPPGFVVSTEDAPLDVRLGVQRVLGTAEHPIEFSVLSAAAIPLSIYFSRNAATSSVRILSAFAGVLALVAMPAAVSRTGVISLAAAMLVYAFAFNVRTILVALTSAAALMVLYFVIFPTTANALWRTITGSEKDPSIRARTEDYVQVSQIFRAHKIFGLGLGGSPTFYDNYWLLTIVQGGIVGIAAMLLLTGGSILGIAAALRSAATPAQREEAYMLGAIVVGILLSSTTFDLLYYQQTSLVLFLVFGLLWSSFAVEVSEPDRHRSDRLLLSCSQIASPRPARRRAASAMPR